MLLLPKQIWCKNVCVLWNNNDDIVIIKTQKQYSRMNVRNGTRLENNNK